MRAFPLKDSPACLPNISWYVAKVAYREYIKKFPSRPLSLNKIAQLGGFTMVEMDEFYPEWIKEPYTFKYGIYAIGDHFYTIEEWIDENVSVTT